MSHITHIYGYIQTDHEEDDHNRESLKNFKFDELWPLPNVFCFPERGPRFAIISFAMAFSSLSEDWLEWHPRFEDLLSTLRALNARVEWSREGFGDLLSVYYLCEDAWVVGGLQKSTKKRWVRHMTKRDEDNKQDMQEEVLLL